MHRLGLSALLVVAALSLAGCGVTPACRAVSTGLLGAGSGAAIGAMAGNPALGALVGGLTGAVSGAASSPRLAYLGRSPICY